MEIVCAITTFLAIMLYLKRRALITELALLEAKVDFLEKELDALREANEPPPLDLTNLVILR